MSLCNFKNERKENTLSGFLMYVLFTCTIYVLPYTKFVVPYILAAAIMLGTLFFIIMKQDKSFELVFLLIFISIFYSFIAWATGRSFIGGINEGIRNIRFFIPAFWGVYALRYCNQRQKNLFILFFSILILFIFIKTTIALEVDPWISRILAQDKSSTSSEINQYRLQNIGGFDFSYMMGIITLCLVYAALKVKKYSLKILFIVLIVLCFNYIISTMYTTLLLLTFLGMLILLLINVKDTVVKLLLISIGLFSLFFLGDIFRLLSTVFPQESLLSSKFESIYQSIYEGDAGQLGDRPQLILESLSKWINNPIFGRYDSTSDSHSMIIGLLEQTGIVGLLTISFLFYIFTKRIYQELKYKKLPTDLYVVSIIFLLLLAFFNPIGYVFEMTIAVYFIVPICTELFYTR